MVLPCGVQPVLKDVVCIRTVVTSYTCSLLHDNQAQSAGRMLDWDAFMAKLCYVHSTTLSAKQQSNVYGDSSSLHKAVKALIT